MHRNFHPFPVLTTERLVLRQTTLNDDKEVFFQRSDKLMNQYIDREPATTVEQAREWINMINRFIDTNESINWGITLKNDPKLIGGFCFWNLSEERQSGEIGYGIVPEHQGKGYMHEVLQKGLHYGFETMKLQIVEAYTHPRNAASVKLLENNGFTLRPGQQIDEQTKYAVFELLKKDWAAKNKSGR